MRRLVAAIALLIALLPHTGLAARHKTGPVFLRGIAHHVRPIGFTLSTTHHGAYSVSILSATSITVKGKPTVLHSGDHVGVRGFVSGRDIRAIYVHIYPIKPKPFSIKGTVTAVAGSLLRIKSGRKTYEVRVTAGTVIKLGLAPASLNAIQVGSSVDARLMPGSPNTALEIRIHRPPQIRVRLKGTVRSFDASLLVVSAAGVTYTVHVTSHTVVYLGNKHAGTNMLRPGRTVTVYACCQGQPLVATSIHVRRVVVTHRTTLLRGRILATEASSITVSIGGRTIVIAFTPSTTFHVGLTPVAATNLRAGDEISARAYRSHGHWVATSIHVYVSSRRPKRIDGTVVSVNGGRMTVLERGKRYVIVVPAGTTVTLNGRRVALGALRPGDRIRTVARPSAVGLVAGSIVARRLPPPSVTVKGVLVRHTGAILIVATAGKHITVKPGSRVQIRMGHTPAPPDALFPGVPVSARGVLNGVVLLASRVSLETRARDLTGRVTAIGNGVLDVKERTGRTVVVRMTQSGASVGTEVRVHGFSLGSAVHGVTLRILHPTLDLTGIAAVNGQSITLVRTNGDRYTLRIEPSTPVTTVRATMTLTVEEIPAGVHLHALGRLQTDGTLRVRSLTVHLASVDLRATVTSLADGELAAGGKTVTIVPQTRFLQGSKPSSFEALVVGDDVTVYGYIARDGVLAREILLHRKLMAVDGTVDTLTPDGFTMTTAGGSLRVILSSTTDSGAITPSPGLSIHVTGYLRGDGVLLAIRLRAGPKHAQLTAVLRQ